MKVLKFKKLHEDATLPTRNEKTDAGLDIYSLVDVEIPPSEVDNSFVGVRIGLVRVPTGIAVEIPDGFYGNMKSRSGLAFNNNILCFEGTIDSPYRGELGVLLYNLTGRPYLVRAGDRVAQLIISPCEFPEPIFVDKLSEDSRGEFGFGSSGR